MPNLQNVLAGSAYRDRRDKIEAQNAASEMQQVGILQKILAQKQAEQQAAALQEHRGNQLGLQGRELDVRQEEAAAARAIRETEGAAARASRETIAADAVAQRSADAAAQREQRMQELKLRLADQRTAQADRSALQRELMMMRADQQRLDAEQKRATNPQAIKEREKLQGKESLTSLLDELDGDYKALEKLGSDISPERNAVSNAYNRVASSGAGQLVAGAVGTKSQEVRDSIATKRAALMASLKQATGMGATQLNSNIELQFYLKMATDPTLSRKANQKAISWLRNTYGIQGVTAAPAPTTAPAAGGLSPQEQQELDALRNRFGR